MAQKNVLGKGLGAIFPDLLNDVDKKKSVYSCGIEELRPNRYQPRKTFHDDKQKDLIASIKNSGIIQPIVVRKLDHGYEIIAGERRWRAAQAAGLKDVPIVIREATDMEAAVMSLIENIQREELNPLEEAAAYTTFIEKFKLSQEEISVQVGKDRSTVANTIRLLKLPARVQNAIMENKISAGHGRCLLALNSQEDQIAALNLILKKDLTVRETERLIQKAKNRPATQQQISKKDRFLNDLEKALTAKLMANVQIKGAAKKGLIEIRYTSMDELNRLSGLILDDLK
jgi:ParB family chromosome partitioning protein